MRQALAARLASNPGSGSPRVEQRRRWLLAIGRRSDPREVVGSRQGCDGAGGASSSSNATSSM